MKKIFILFSLTIATTCGFAQVNTNGELKNLINESFGYFPQIKEVQNQVTVAEQQLLLAKTNLPVVDGNASYEYVKPKIVLPLEIDGKVQNFQFAPVNNADFNVSASYVLLDFGRLKASVDKSKADLSYATDNVTNAKAQLASQVADIYYNITYLKKAVTIEDSVLNFLNENLRIANSKLKNGEAIKLDVLNIQAQVDVEQNNKADLQNNLQKQYSLLDYTTGAANIQGSDFNFDIQLPEEANIVNLAQGSANYRMLQDKINSSKADVSAAQAKDHPYLSLNAKAGGKNGYVPVVNDIRFNYQAGAALKVPIFSGGKTKQQVAIASSVVRQNELAVETFNNNYKKDVDQALIDIKTNMEKMQHTASQIENAEAAKQTASSRYLNGIGTNIEITNAAVNVQRIELTRLQYEYKLCLAKVELARLTGLHYWE